MTQVVWEWIRRRASSLILTVKRKAISLPLPTGPVLSPLKNLTESSLWGEAGLVLLYLLTPMLSQAFSNTTPHCLDVSFLLNNKPWWEKAGLVWFISDYCRSLDSSLLTSVPQSLRRLRISVSNALLAGGETLDAPLSMTAALCRAAGERLGGRQRNRSARRAAFRGSASSRGEEPMSSAHCLEQINSQNSSRLALHLLSHCCEPKIIRMIFSTIFLEGSGNPSDWSQWRVLGSGSLRQGRYIPVAWF